MDIYPNLLLFVAATSLSLILLYRSRFMAPRPQALRYCIGAGFLCALGSLGGALGGALASLISYSPLYFLPAVLLFGLSVYHAFAALNQLNENQQRQAEREQEALQLLKSMDQGTKNSSKDSNAIDQFIANMSHEFRTPLNAILGFSDMLLKTDDALGAATKKDYLEIINTSGEELLAMVNNLLALNKNNAGPFPLSMTETSSKKLINTAVDQMRLDSEAKSVALTVDLIDSPFKTDERLFHQIMVNLLSNAIKFTPQNGTVNVSVTAEDRALHIQIMDSGIGMSENDISVVTLPFVKASSNSAPSNDDEQGDLGYNASVQKGAGLGLALVKKFVALLSGSLTIQSDQGKGTVIDVVLPTLERTQDSLDDDPFGERYGDQSALTQPTPIAAQ